MYAIKIKESKLDWLYNNCLLLSMSEQSFIILIISQKSSRVCKYEGQRKWRDVLYNPTIHIMHIIILLY